MQPVVFPVIVAMEPVVGVPLVRECDKVGIDANGERPAYSQVEFWVAYETAERAIGILPNCQVDCERVV